MSHDVKFNKDTFLFSSCIDSQSSNVKRVRTLYKDKDENENLDLIHEATPHTDQRHSVQDLTGMVDELTTHTDTSPSDPI